MNISLVQELLEQLKPVNESEERATQVKEKFQEFFNFIITRRLTDNKKEAEKEVKIKLQNATLLERLEHYYEAFKDLHLVYEGQDVETLNQVPAAIMATMLKLQRTKSAGKKNFEEVVEESVKTPVENADQKIIKMDVGETTNRDVELMAEQILHSLTDSAISFVKENQRSADVSVNKEVKVENLNENVVSVSIEEQMMKPSGKQQLTEQAHTPEIQQQTIQQQTIQQRDTLADDHQQQMNEQQLEQLDKEFKLQKHGDLFLEKQQTGEIMISTEERLIVEKQLKEEDQQQHQTQQQQLPISENQQHELQQPISTEHVEMFKIQQQQQQQQLIETEQLKEVTEQTVDEAAKTTTETTTSTLTTTLTTPTYTTTTTDTTITTTISTVSEKAAVAASSATTTTTDSMKSFTTTTAQQQIQPISEECSMISSPSVIQDIESEPTTTTSASDTSPTATTTSETKVTTTPTPDFTYEIIDGDIQCKIDETEKLTLSEDGKTSTTRKVMTRNYYQQQQRSTLQQGVVVATEQLETFVGKCIDEYVFESPTEIKDPYAANVETTTSIDENEETLEDGTWVKKKVTMVVAYLSNEDADSPSVFQEGMTAESSVQQQPQQQLQQQQQQQPQQQTEMYEDKSQLLLNKVADGPQQVQQHPSQELQQNIFSDSTIQKIFYECLGLEFPEFFSASASYVDNVKERIVRVPPYRSTISKVKTKTETPKDQQQQSQQQVQQQPQKQYEDKTTTTKQGKPPSFIIPEPQQQQQRPTRQSAATNQQQQQKRIIRSRVRKLITRKIRKTLHNGDVIEDVITEEIPDVDMSETSSVKSGYSDVVLGMISPRSRSSVASATSLGNATSPRRRRGSGSSHSSLKIYTDTVEGEPEITTDVQEREETLPDGRVIVRKTIKTKQKQTIVKRVVLEGGDDGNMETTGCNNFDDESFGPALKMYTDALQGFGGCIVGDGGSSDSSFLNEWLRQSEVVASNSGNTDTDVEMMRSFNSNPVVISRIQTTSATRPKYRVSMERTDPQSVNSLGSGDGQNNDCDGTNGLNR
ncbi:hypothetical protein HELRODRAFT_190034 [Helobdella robusta]|uniref:Uncharacterized protein n=1 Tax=Helobdella robusta TaxID=6412 RepID=T1FRM0_HELRO|nr:hypothetical protein HELRODRAFT_190034 [Helobdella robusta]ESO11627.1 hypothetical protein HELRODRAFT_190034 [Helobdella robusta]